MEQQFAWWQQGIFYQIYPRSYMDGNGDGIGDLAGIRTKLDYLAWLGVDAIWLSPIYPSPMVDFGYDITDHRNVDPLFGTLETSDALIAEAHQRGLKLLMDFVPNHTSDQHPWFQESRSTRLNPKRDWYVWADAQPDGAAPNNWLSIMGGSAWEWDAGTSQYYLHTFLKQQPDLNWRNPAVKEAMFAVVRFWLDRGIDGFRVDAAHFILKDPDLRNNPPNLSAQPVLHKSMGEYDTLIHLYDTGHPDVHAVYRELRTVLDSYGNDQSRIIIGEIHLKNRKEWTTFYGTHLDEFHLPFNFGLVTVAWNAQAIRTQVEELEEQLPPGAWPNYVLGNHDEPRISSRVGDVNARLAMLLLLTLRGTPTMYYGDEIGMHDGTIPPEYIRDPLAQNLPGLALGRDPSRTPMQWNNSPHAGFCPPEVAPWLPIPPDYLQINVADEQLESTSLLSFTRRLIALRRAIPALSVGSYQHVAAVPEDCFAFIRHHHGRRYLIALNFADHARTVQLPRSSASTMLLSTLVEPAQPTSAGSLHLREHEGQLVELTANS